MSLNIQDDLCLIESKGEQRLIAACICSPSYWDVRTKIGKPLNEIHSPVTSLEEKIGNRISTKLYKYKICCILLTTIISFPLASKEATSMIGYWLTSQSICTL